ncbi:AraC-type DNA-binding domain and AraC-containing proteins (AraC) (PDB:1BL0) [Commensalibacter communis]|uniref:AraC-type DNA-binding domain and AraC-containing proteins (AraC) n=1 Tax=Commensalibacter communis TaxID=2972786 RepID=A0A9W4TPW3_9PROT|nr:AraC family transcriptional regulator [Commensalibacter communis]CAI3955356.1 AraC-type DNA-binding domain and AraC-containing proteins (AraC) (PDB:1BL0) [Commensalibacter communis]CAI3955576.1 AraC-type DNA-binding domain and AraC-containing proteins (AraC) (PDB:1BL0) [Commensalibacter communis]CAI3957066.1 AraC-type DNA-binding domain and AraC-containing proteins (AraC) (PDB:1BL0) [Commensalibacter communis]CAI3957597.1 AraC-type DNA-binding domain and AraC-containing proteins (AraC) (PDB:
MNLDSHLPPITTSSEAAYHEQTISYYDGTISLKNGTIKTSTQNWQTEPLFDGLKIIIIDNNELLCKLPHSPTSRIAGPCVCAVWNRGDAEGSQSFPAGCLLRYTAVTLSANNLLNNFTESLETLDSKLQLHANKPKLITIPLPQSIRKLCIQISNCPFQGNFRNMYLSGKALELAAHTLETIQPSSQKNIETKFKGANFEKIFMAKDILIQRMQNPPSLSELALLVGINTRKLTIDFRKVFGDSVFGYLQTLRLDAAYQMLSEGELNVSSIAYQIGYTPAHLSVAFRKKFGICPKDIHC